MTNRSGMAGAVKSAGPAGIDWTEPVSIDDTITACLRRERGEGMMMTLPCHEARINEVSEMHFERV
jgi:hypothetical protein